MESVVRRKSLTFPTAISLTPYIASAYFKETTSESEWLWAGKLFERNRVYSFVALIQTLFTAATKAVVVPQSATQGRVKYRRAHDYLSLLLLNIAAIKSLEDKRELAIGTEFLLLSTKH